METPWNTATDIWSFGTMVRSNYNPIMSKTTMEADLHKLISLIYGGDFNIFQPQDASYDDENYRVEIVESQFRFFGPFPAKYQEIASEETLTSVLHLMHLNPPSKMTPFDTVTEREVTKEDKEFILKIMHMDWRDRPTARELLQDEWFLHE